MFVREKKNKSASFSIQVVSKENGTHEVVKIIGPELIFGSIYDEIGFNQINNDKFRHLVLAHLSFPSSKLKTVDYLRRYQGVEIKIDAVYFGN